MPLAINPIGSTLYTPRALQRIDDTVSPLQQRQGLDTRPSADEVNERLQLAREANQQRFEERQRIADQRREELRDEQTEQLRRDAEEANLALQERLQQLQVEQNLEAQRAADEQALQNQASIDDALAQQRLQIDANQATFGEQQAAVGPRVAAEAISVYQETQQTSVTVGQGVIV
ncbi:hypothetical protein IB229_04570 [Pseudomonas sp. PDM14]|uniref:hypothetical protein n=1 Tax=Pseudomonas sp. PDM14 TaxID=2769288 RepID=UPI0017807989|nr:hypothetical protein [Pseudomonas sp. PDM14]MBD9482232.1 hypothetical protein [Pseudomonas sp. PDM14]